MFFLGQRSGSCSLRPGNRLLPGQFCAWTVGSSVKLRALPVPFGEVLVDFGTGTSNLLISLQGIDGCCNIRTVAGLR